MAERAAHNVHLHNLLLNLIYNKTALYMTYLSQSHLYAYARKLQAYCHVVGNASSNDTEETSARGPGTM